MDLFWRARLILSSLQVQREPPATEQLRMEFAVSELVAHLFRAGDKCNAADL